MSQVFGEATDFWRLRLVTIDESGEPDLEWRDDILYRRPPATPMDEGTVYRVDAVSIDGEERVVPLATFGQSQLAHDYLDRALEDLQQMTKSEFERSYFDPARGVESVDQSTM